MIGSSPLNVCMYTPTAQGGHALYAHELLAAIAEVGPERGVSAELVTCEDLDDVSGVPYPIHPILPRQVPREEYRSRAGWAASRVAYYIKRERTFLDWVAGRRDIALIHFQEYTPWLAPKHFHALRRLGIPLVFTVHNIKGHYCKYLFHDKIRDVCFRSAWRDCDALLVHTEGLRRSLAGYLAGEHPPIHVTPHGVWNGDGPHVHEPQASNGTRERLLFFGVIRPNKGVHVLLRALELLPHCDLTIAGGAEEPGYLEVVRSEARKFPPGRVELIDRYVSEEEMANLFEQCRVVVLPYTSFTSQSGVLHQALRYGRPVVATDVGAMGECVRRWGIGEVVPPSDEAALAGGIERALDARCYRASAKAMERVRGELTWARMAAATIDVYHSIVG
jgi:glycosyltransferase involved in cell wall biosynthesis